MSASNTYDSARSTAANLESDANRIGAELSDKFSDAAHQVQQQAQVQVDRLSSSIRDKPLQAAAIAAGVGFLFAVIARR